MRGFICALFIIGLLLTAQAHTASAQTLDIGLCYTDAFQAQFAAFDSPSAAEFDPPSSRVGIMPNVAALFTDGSCFLMEFTIGSFAPNDFGGDQNILYTGDLDGAIVFEGEIYAPSPFNEVRSGDQALCEPNCPISDPPGGGIALWQPVTPVGEFVEVIGAEATIVVDDVRLSAPLILFDVDAGAYPFGDPNPTYADLLNSDNVYVKFGADEVIPTGTDQFVALQVNTLSVPEPAMASGLVAGILALVLLGAGAARANDEKVMEDLRDDLQVCEDTSYTDEALRECEREVVAEAVKRLEK